MRNFEICLSSIVALSLTGLIHAQENHEDVTYNGEIAQILNENCVTCHQEGGIGPMLLETYDQVRPWAPLISFKVANREMPPYAYDQGIGIQNLIGDWRLEQSEIDQIVEWANQGAPLGDPDVLPPSYQGKDPGEWNFVAELGRPHLIVPSSSYDIPANGNDLWSREIVNPGITENRCLKAVQVKPRGDAAAVVHHANSSVLMPDEDGELTRSGMLTEYAMGKWGEIVPDGVCRTIPAGSQIRWDIHMFPGGVGATAQGDMIEDNVVEIGLWFHEEGYESSGKIYKQDLAQYDIQFKDARDRNAKMVIPPNGHYMTQGFHSFDHPVRIDSFQPHGHLRMNAASFEIFYPETGKTEQISQISNWSATWHHSHIYESDVAPLVPTGAVLVLRQWYDNTVDNPNNPDPDQWVYGGSRTGDEMSHVWMAITHLDDAGFEKLVADRKDRESRSIVGND